MGFLEKQNLPNVTVYGTFSGQIHQHFNVPKF